jgi:transposase
MARATRELTDAQWARLQPLLPPQRPKTGRPNKDHRLVLEASSGRTAPARRGATSQQLRPLEDCGQSLLERHDRPGVEVVKVA